MPTVFSNSTRLGLSLVAIVLVLLLAGARWLEPSPSGFGTHRQFGLPPCTIYALFSIKCPSCGMTTAWALTVRFQFQEALNANIAGTFLCLQAIVSVPYLVVMVMLRRDPLGRFFQSATVWGVIISFAIAVAVWGTTLMFSA